MPAYLSIAVKRLDLALKVLENIGRYELKLATVDAGLIPEDGDIHQRLIAEYYVLRTALARFPSALHLSLAPNILTGLASRSTGHG